MNDKLQGIKKESLRIGNGVMIRFEDFDFLIEQAEKNERYEKALELIANDRLGWMDRTNKSYHRLQNIAVEAFKDK